MNSQSPQVLGATARPRAFLLCLLAAALAWSYWPVLATMVERWTNDPRYSHGFLVPLFGLFLLYHRRDRLERAAFEPSWWGVPALASGEVLRFLGARYYLGWIEGIALLPSLAGLALLAFGRRGLRWAAPAVGFLLFMVPLPYRVENAVGYPLQRCATLASNYCLQTLGLPAVAEGNIILLDDFKIGVVEACNGLGMIFMFLAFTVGMTLTIRRGPIEDVLLILGTLPIALAANIARITMTGLLHATAGGKVADAVYHDLSGWLMMPLALGAVWLELYLLSHLLIEPPRGQAAPSGVFSGMPIPPSRGA